MKDRGCEFPRSAFVGSLFRLQIKNGWSSRPRCPSPHRSQGCENLAPKPARRARPYSPSTPYTLHHSRHRSGRRAKTNVLRRRRRWQKPSRRDRRGGGAGSGRQEKGVAGHRPAQTATQDAQWLAQGCLGETTELSLLGEESAPGGQRRYLRLAAIYARVSTDKQKKEQTIDSQLDALRNAALEDGG